MWDCITNTHTQSNASFTSYRCFLSKHFWNRTESKTLTLQESSLERQFNRLEDIFSKILSQIFLCHLLNGQNNIARAPSEFPITPRGAKGERSSCSYTGIPGTEMPLPWQFKPHPSILERHSRADWENIFFKHSGNIGVTNFDIAGISGAAKGLSTASKYSITWCWEIQLGFQRPKLKACST